MINADNIYQLLTIKVWVLNNPVKTKVYILNGTDFLVMSQILGVWVDEDVN